MLSASSRGLGGGGQHEPRGRARPRSEPLPSTVFPQPRPRPALPPPCLCGALKRGLNPGFLLLFQKTIPQEILPAKYLCGSHTDLST